MARLASLLPELPGSGIVYTLTVPDAKRLARWLQSQGIDAEPYYGALETNEREILENLLAAMRTANSPLTIPKLQERVNLPKGKIERILEFLLLESPAPIQKAAAGYVLNPVRWQMPVERVERITNLRRGELERMQVYMGSRDCLMQFLAEELNDPSAGPAASA